jgi:hypothetical protein
MSYILPLADAGLADISRVGGKAVGIGKLIAAGARVPAGFCIQTDALADLLANWSPADSGETPIPGDDLDRSSKAALRIRDACMNAPLPAGLVSEVAQALDRLPHQAAGDAFVMVRSSATVEDVATARAPGVYTSVRVPADIDAVLDAVRTVWMSSADDDSRKYRAGLSSEPAEAAPMAVVVQEFVAAQLGGAVSTIDPATGDADRMVISWTQGHPADLLSSLDPGSTVVIEKPYSSMEMAKLPALISALPAEALRLEVLLNEPLDIEFVVSAAGTVYLIQCRPMPYRQGWRLASRLTADPVDSAQLHSPKIDAARINNLEVTDPFGRIVVWPSVFEVYRANGGFPVQVRDQLSESLRPLLDVGEVALRPAYWSALHSTNNMPQSGRLSSAQQCLEHLAKLFDYVIDNRLDDYTAEVAVLVGNWLTVVASAVAASDTATTSVHIDAVAGYPEALETEGYDTCEVDVGSGEASMRRRPGGHADALSPEEYRRVAATCYALSRRLNSPLRIEVLIVERDETREMVVWQVDRIGTRPRAATYAITALGSASSEPVLTGRALKVESLTDIIDFPPDNDSDVVLILDLSQLPPRDRAGQIFFAQRVSRSKNPVVLRGSPLSHLAALLREYDVAVYPVRVIDDLVSGTSVAITAEIG